MGIHGRLAQRIDFRDDDAADLQELRAVVEIANMEVVAKRKSAVGAQARARQSAMMVDASKSINARGQDTSETMREKVKHDIAGIESHPSAESLPDYQSKPSDTNLPTIMQAGQPQTNLTKFFSGFISFAIFTNALFMGFETDMENDAKDFFLWGELTFVAIFTIELIVRLKVNGVRDFFINSEDERWWNWFDTLLVVYAIADNVVSIYFGDDLHGGLALLLRTIRLLRLLRVARLFKFFRDLLLLIVGLANALRLLVWVWLLLVVIIFFFAILSTRLIGKPYGSETTIPLDNLGNQVLEDATDEQKIHYYMGTVPRAMFTLFEIMTTETWAEIAELTMKKMPFSIAIILAYMLITTFAMLNVVVAVTVNVTLDSSAALKEDEARKERKHKIMNLTRFCMVFNLMDENGDGVVTREEFDSGLKLPEVHEILGSVGFEKSDAKDLFDILDKDENDCLEVLEFCMGMFRTTIEAKGRDLLEVHCDLWKSSRQESVAMIGKLQSLTNELSILEMKVRQYANDRREDGSNLTYVAL